MTTPFKASAVNHLKMERLLRLDYGQVKSLPRQVDRIFERYEGTDIEVGTYTKHLSDGRIRVVVRTFEWNEDRTEYRQMVLNCFFIAPNGDVQENYPVEELEEFSAWDDPEYAHFRPKGLKEGLYVGMHLPRQKS